MRPERFTEQAREIIASSQELAVTYRHSQWDVEHLFMALLRQENGIGVDIFNKLGINIDAVKRRLESVLNNIPRVSGKIINNRQSDFSGHNYYRSSRTCAGTLVCGSQSI